MRFSAVEASVTNVPIRDGIDMPIGSFSSLDHIVVRIATSDGLSGLGEVTVIPEFMGETLDQVLRDLDVLASRLEDDDLEEPGRVHALIDRVLPAARSARAAIDEACFDIVGKRLGVPAWRLLGERYRDRVDCTWTIGLKSPEATVEDAAARHAQGFRTFKIKVGKNDAEDLLKVRLVRETLGPEVAIRLDANGAYAPERALSILERLQVYDIEMVEQPCPALELVLNRIG